MSDDVENQDSDDGENKKLTAARARVGRAIADLLAAAEATGKHYRHEANCSCVLCFGVREYRDAKSGLDSL